MLLPNALRISDKRYVRLTTFPRAQQQLQDWNNIAKNLAVWSDGGIHRKQTTSVIEHGVSKLKRTPGPRSITDQLALGLIEGVLTVLGLIVLVFPLALWAVPQHGPLANTVFYIVLSIGSGSLTGLIALAYLKSILFPRQSSDAAPMSGKARLQAYQNWEQTKGQKTTALPQRRRPAQFGLYGSHRHANCHGRQLLVPGHLGNDGLLLWLHGDHVVGSKVSTAPSR